jgi:hypothetical protein
MSEVKQAPEHEIIRAWCASCGMPAPSTGDCMALVAALSAPAVEPVAVKEATEEDKAIYKSIADNYTASLAEQAATQAEAEPIEYGTKDPMLLGLQADLQIMMASAKAEGDEFVTGYRIKTGAIHRIIGAMQEAGYPVNLPNLAAPTAPTGAQAEPMTLKQFCAEADRIGLTAETFAAQLATRPEFAEQAAPKAEPTAKPIAGLTEEEIAALACVPDTGVIAFAQAITRALAEKNGLAVQGGE